MEVEFLETTEVHGMQVYQADKAIISSQVATAKAYPRNLKRCIENAITVATLSTDIAKSCMFSLTKGGKNITGPSVNLAKILAQQMGNLRIENTVVGFDATHVTCCAIAFDLEKNYAVKTTIKRSIVGSTGRYSEDMCVITGNAGNAIALRNAVFAVIPQQIIDQVYSAAQEKILGKLSEKSTLITKRTDVLNKLKETYHEMKLLDEEIIRTVGKSSVDHLTREDLITLIGFEKSIQDGEIKFEQVFRPTVTIPVAQKPEDKSGDRILQLIANSKTRDDLKKHEKFATSTEAKVAYDNKYKELK